MFWWGRVNAFLWFLFWGGMAVCLLMGEFAAAGGWMLVMFLLRGLLGLLNRLWTLFTGNPLFYETKLIDRRRGRVIDDD